MRAAQSSIKRGLECISQVACMNVKKKKKKKKKRCKKKGGRQQIGNMRPSIESMLFLANLRFNITLSELSYPSCLSPTSSFFSRPLYFICVTLSFYFKCLNITEKRRRGVGLIAKAGYVSQWRINHFKFFSKLRKETNTKFCLPNGTFRIGFVYLSFNLKSSFYE